MTKVTYLHGIPANEYKDRGKQVGPQAFLNYGKMTVGETRLALAAEQAKILAAYYPEDQQFAIGAQELDNLLYRGLHNGIYLGLSAPAFVRRAVGQARGKTQPEGGGILEGRSGVGSTPLIPYDDCARFMQDTSLSFHERTRLISDCLGKNREIEILNTHLEKSAHHLLYEYAKTTNIPATVATKRVLHRNAVSKVGQLFEFDRENLRLWLRNGIMRNNALNGAPPFQPEITIDALKPGAGIGEPITIAAVTAIITAIIGAIGATVSLLQAMKAARAQEIRTVAQGIGTQTFSAEQEDWDGHPQGSPGGSGADKGINDYLPFILGGAALLMMKK